MKKCRLQSATLKSVARHVEVSDNEHVDSLAPITGGRDVNQVDIMNAIQEKCQSEDLRFKIMSVYWLQHLGVKHAARQECHPEAGEN